MPDGLARNNLRTAIGDRDATPPYLAITRETLQFNTASDHWLDVAVFEALLAAEQTGKGTNPQFVVCRRVGKRGTNLWHSIAFLPQN
jgi:hypothetical protein